MFDSVIGLQMTVPSFLICECGALVLGLLTALVFNLREKHSGAFSQTLALLPSVVALVIMMVNGNIGAGLGVAGAFALVRFRSAPGSAVEIAGIFFSMAIGLACGMGYVGYAALFFLLLSVSYLLLKTLGFGTPGSGYRILRITIPENLDYDALFDDLFTQYTRSHELQRVRTTNMGTLYELTYDVVLKDPANTRAFIDALRCRNGNLGISVSRENQQEFL